MKEPSFLLGQTHLTSREISKVIIQTEEQFSTREANERMVNIVVSNYAKSYLEQEDDNTTQTNGK